MNKKEVINFLKSLLINEKVAFAEYIIETMDKDDFKDKVKSSIKKYGNDKNNFKLYTDFFDKYGAEVDVIDVILNNKDPEKIKEEIDRFLDAEYIGVITNNIEKYNFIKKYLDENKSSKNDKLLLKFREVYGYLSNEEFIKATTKDKYDYIKNMKEDIRNYYDTIHIPQEELHPLEIEFFNNVGYLVDEYSIESLKNKDVKKFTHPYPKLKRLLDDKIAREILQDYFEYIDKSVENEPMVFKDQENKKEYNILAEVKWLDDNFDKRKDDEEYIEKLEEYLKHKEINSLEDYISQAIEHNKEKFKNEIEAFFDKFKEFDKEN